MYRKTFRAVYDQYKERDGESFFVMGVIGKPDNKHDKEVLPMYRIRFGDGTIIEAWPEEVLRNV